MTRQLLILLAILFAAVSLWHQGYITDQTFLSSKRNDSEKQGRQVVLHITQLERRHFDIDGKPSSQLYTDQARQYSDDQEHLYLDKTIFFFGENIDSQWRGQAQQAKLHIDSETSLLIGDVKFNQLQSNTTINTDTLKVDNHKKTATTADLVKVYNEDSETTATGMVAKLQEHIIQLQSNVHSIRFPVFDSAN